MPRQPRSARSAPATKSPLSADATVLLARFHEHLRLTQGEAWETAQPFDHFVSLARATRDQIVDRMIATQTLYSRRDVKRVYYLSLEYLLGRMLKNHLVCLGIYDECVPLFAELGLELDTICELQPDAGLGNGGLGRLAACYLDSAATLGLPVYGYGLRYEFGIFRQEIIDGWQVERPDYWLRFGSPWEIARPECSCPVRLYGHVEPATDRQGRYRPQWRGYKVVMGVPYDWPILGYGGETVNFLRLWSARAPEMFDLAAFNRGGYVEAVAEQARTETLTKVLYPADDNDAGRELRLAQQYFFVACTLNDVLRRFLDRHQDFALLPDRVAVQLNDTHPALGVAELMRILVDERGLEWEQAWDITQRVFHYTNHTLLPEALEKWPVALLARVLPRHLQIIFEINQRFLDGPVASRWPGDGARRQRLSLIEEGPTPLVRMANLAIVGSRRVNGVAALHTDLLQERVVPDFAALWPEKFLNVTNGVTPRRWVLACNPDLSRLIKARLGPGWVRELAELRKLAPLADDPSFRAEVRAAKRACKDNFADWLQRNLHIAVSPDALFDVQVKRLHEYKRQLLNILYVVMRYQAMCDDPGTDFVPRVVFFGAKAAPAYSRAKLIIKLINDVARTIQQDERVRDRLRVVFLPNYDVSLAERVIPAADLSQQISTAGHEASGTGNMKFALNGALTIGTLDGANIEIRNAVGAENFFLFGLTAEEVAMRRMHHDPWAVYQSHAAVRRALDSIADGAFSPRAPHLFQPIRDWLTHERDVYMLMADIESYVAAQDRVDALWRDPAAWDRAAVLNIANMGYFSSDRSVGEYAEHIWGVAPIVAPAAPRRILSEPVATAPAQAKATGSGRRTSSKAPDKKG
ncbi:MAG: glycogen/starch/alpha-glucan phosphorylase [Phycisphaerales bacterium]|nr:glycogen/starch/alpha-glucan phosphorylase [Phycisphaerales bacterium]